MKNQVEDEDFLIYQVTGLTPSRLRVAYSRHKAAGSNDPVKDALDEVRSLETREMLEYIFGADAIRKGILP